MGEVPKKYSEFYHTRIIHNNNSWKINNTNIMPIKTEGHTGKQLLVQHSCSPVGSTSKVVSDNGPMRPIEVRAWGVRSQPGSFHQQLGTFSYCRYRTCLIRHVTTLTEVHLSGWWKAHQDIQLVVLYDNETPILWIQNNRYSGDSVPDIWSLENMRDPLELAPRTTILTASLLSPPPNHNLIINSTNYPECKHLIVPMYYYTLACIRC